MKVAYSLYRLSPLASLSAKASQRDRQGALLRVTFSNNLIGYSDCHPWSELGDLPLQEQLEGLKKGVITPLLERSLYWARLDGEARLQGRSLFEDVPPLFSHFLVSDLQRCTPHFFSILSQQGYTHLKIKLGRCLEVETQKLLGLFKDTSFKLRLDLNETLSFLESERFFETISPLFSHIEFIEDPLPFEEHSWSYLQKEYKVPLACDRQALRAYGCYEASRFLVIKPAIQDPVRFGSTLQYRVITSYLDHPIGQVCAAYSAAMMDAVQIHGLHSHHAYEMTPFSHSFSWDSPHFKVPEGPGWGFTTLLTTLKWETLC